MLGAAALLISLIQTFVFRNQLNPKWVAIHTIAGIVVGLFYNFLFFKYDTWWVDYPGMFFMLWVVGNFALGSTLLNKRQEKPGEDSSTPLVQPTIERWEPDTHPNLFFISLSISSLLFSLLVFSILLSLTSAADIFTILLGIANILVSILFLVKKDIPRNLGFITLAISTFLYGIFIELEYFISDFPLSLYSIAAFASLTSGIFFLTQRETQKDFRFLALSGFLLSLSFTQITRDIYSIYNIFSILSALFALVAAVLFFRGK
jgi:hypothetical protein